MDAEAPPSLRSLYEPLVIPPRAERPLHVVLACTGSVASVKVPLLVERLLQHGNVQVHVVASAASLRFFDAQQVHRLDAIAAQDYTVADLAAENAGAQRRWLGEQDTPEARKRVPRARVWTDDDEWSAWAKLGDPVLHIELRRWADIVLLAPCSADTLAKVAHGLCDNLLTSMLRALAPDTPTLLFPAMNTLMYLHPFTRKQLDAVREELGYEVYGPITKRLACGDRGAGAMLEWSEIAQLVAERYGMREAPDEGVTA